MRRKKDQNTDDAEDIERTEERAALPVGFLDIVLGRAGADAQRVVELCLLDHLGWFGLD